MEKFSNGEKLDIMSENLPALRKAFGVSQTELADTLGVSRSTIATTENGRRKLDQGMYLQLSVLFGKNRESYRLMKKLGIGSETTSHFGKNPEKSELEINETTLPMIEKIAEQMLGGFFIYRADESEEILYFNRLMVEYMGCSDNEDFISYTGNSFKGLVHPDDYVEVNKTIQCQIQLNTNNLDHVCYRSISKDGKIRWFNDYGHFSHSDSFGDVFYVFIIDVTDTIMDRNNHGTGVRVEQEQKKIDSIISEMGSDQIAGALDGLRILLVDDNELTRDIGGTILAEEGAIVSLACDGQEAIDFYKNNSELDAILMDIVMPNVDGIEAVKQIRAMESQNEFPIPIIMLTSEGSDSQVQESLSAGANDCMSKPLVASVLSRILISCMKEHSSVMEKKLENTIKMASTDPLTKVKNIMAYTDHIAALSNKISEHKKLKFSIVMCDINGLKKANDTFGHDVGDLYIKNCCRIICRIFAHSPVYRIGGDEFVAILQGSDYNNRDKLMKTLYAEVLKAEHITSFKNGRASLAAGIADYIPEKDLAVSDVVKRADTVMYKIKARTARK